jgi:hypothetical protein
MRRNALTPRTPRTVVSTLEGLESRRLFADINVADFGARPNDGQDDTGAIRAAMAASKAGDTINFAAGEYTINDTITARSNREYKGWGGATLKREGQGFIFQNDNSNYNITFTDLTFDRGGVNVAADRTGEHILIRGCTFKDMQGGWPIGDAIFAPSGLRDSKITRSTFKDIEGDNGLYGFNTFDRVEISHNHFDNVWEGIHLYYNSGSDLKVIYNTGVNWTRMPVELQGRNAKNTLVEGNKFTSWRSDKVYHESFALSIMNYGEGTIIRNNIVSGPHEAPVGIEVGGRRGLVEGNVITGFREGMHLVDTTGTEIRNNQFRDQGLVAIWRTGVDEGRDLRIHGNTIDGAKWGFLFSGGNSEGTVVENNTVSRAEKGIVGEAPGVKFDRNTFNDVSVIR